MEMAITGIIGRTSKDGWKDVVVLCHHAKTVTIASGYHMVDITRLRVSFKGLLIDPSCVPKNTIAMWNTMALRRCVNGLFRQDSFGRMVPLTSLRTPRQTLSITFWIEEQ